MTVLTTITCLLLHALALYGWGRGVERGLRLSTDSPALTTALGLAGVLALGGVLNLLGLAHAPSLWALTTLGLVLGALSLQPGFAPARSAALSPVATSGTLLCALVVCALVVSTLVPAWAFNYHDDYQKYFAHPVRMLQTGTLRGCSASALGFETLGGQAFLHGFVLSVGAVAQLNAVDLGFALPLCLALAGIGASADRLQTAARMLAVLCVLALNPQVVNISATYTASALCLGWVELGRNQRTLKGPQLTSYACASGLLFAALSALKTTFVLLSGILFVLSCAALAAHSGWAAARRWAAFTALTATLALLPWLLLHLPTYLSALGQPRMPVLQTLATPYEVNLVSLVRDLYGADNLASYTFGVLTCAMIATYAFRRAQNAPDARPWLAYLAVVLSATLLVMYLVLLYVVAPRSQGSVTIMRLFAPIFLALAPGLLVLTAEVTQARDKRERLAPLLMALAICLPFAHGLSTRAGQALMHGSILAFPGLAEDEDYIRYNSDVLYGPFQQRSAAAQQTVPEGAAVIAITNTPFWLDFTRNPISDIEPAGLATPWALIPAASYVIWEFNGFATIQLRTYEAERDRAGLLQARIGDAGLRLTRVLIQLARSSPLLYNDGHTVVMKLPSATSFRDAYAATVPTR